VAFNIDVEHYMELSAKPVLELDKKLELKKYNLASVTALLGLTL